MTAGEFNKRQLQNSIALHLEEEPKTQRDHDIFNLKQVRYSIKYGSPWYRYGVIASLDRVIEMLEESKAYLAWKEGHLKGEDHGV